MLSVNWESNYPQSQGYTLFVAIQISVKGIVQGDLTNVANLDLFPGVLRDLDKLI